MQSVAMSGGAGTHPPDHPWQNWGQPQVHSSRSLCFGRQARTDYKSVDRLSDRCEETACAGEDGQGEAPRRSLGRGTRADPWPMCP